MFKRRAVRVAAATVAVGLVGAGLAFNGAVGASGNPDEPQNAEVPTEVVENEADSDVALVAHENGDAEFFGTEDLSEEELAELDAQFAEFDKCIEEADVYFAELEGVDVDAADVEVELSDAELEEAEAELSDEELEAELEEAELSDAELEELEAEIDDVFAECERASCLRTSSFLTLTMRSEEAFVEYEECLIEAGGRYRSNCRSRVAFRFSKRAVEQRCCG